MQKGHRFQWEEKHTEAVRKLKELLASPPLLRRVNYKCGRPIVLIVDTSPIAASWAVGQDDVDGNRFAIGFGTKVLSTRQRDYPQVKRELWGVVFAMKAEKKYLIGRTVVVETDCLPLLGMITNCTTPDIAMLRWIAYIKSLNPELKHIAGKDNPVADMLSRARYEGEEEMIDDEDDVDTIFYSVARVEKEGIEPFAEELYEGELLDIGGYLITLVI